MLFQWCLTIWACPTNSKVAKTRGIVVCCSGLTSRSVSLFKLGCVFHLVFCNAPKRSRNIRICLLRGFGILRLHVQQVWECRLPNFSDLGSSKCQTRTETQQSNFQPVLSISCVHQQRRVSKTSMLSILETPERNETVGRLFFFLF